LEKAGPGAARSREKYGSTVEEERRAQARAFQRANLKQRALEKE